MDIFRLLASDHFSFNDRSCIRHFKFYFLFYVWAFTFFPLQHLGFIFIFSLAFDHLDSIFPLHSKLWFLFLLNLRSWIIFPLASETLHFFSLTFDPLESFFPWIRPVGSTFRLHSILWIFSPLAFKTLHLSPRILFYPYIQGFGLFFPCISPFGLYFHLHSSLESLFPLHSRLWLCFFSSIRHNGFFFPL